MKQRHFTICKYSTRLIITLVLIHIYFIVPRDQTDVNILKSNFFSDLFVFNAKTVDSTSENTPCPHSPPVLRHVPANVSRFNYPWRIPQFISTTGINETNGRLLYSPQRLISPDGLGHALATNNADITTAWRLGLTYTHRTARFGSLTEPLKSNEKRIAGDEFQSPRAIENFFGWGAGEISREAVQYYICPEKKRSVAENECIVCDENDRLERVRELRGIPINDRPFELRVDEVVIVPMNLSYAWVTDNSGGLEKYRKEFLEKHNRPFTVFMMPPERCSFNPAYSKFPKTSYSFYFHKYWASHTSTEARSQSNPNTTNEDKYSISFRDFYNRFTVSLRIPKAISRGALYRMNESEVNIAVHARRGDFFRVGRPMVSLNAFVRVIRKMASIVTSEKMSVFSSMPISVAIYSEGSPVINSPISHDVSKMDNVLLDVDRSKVEHSTLYAKLMDHDDGLGDVFPNGLRLHIRVSQPTMLCLHEMVAADIFIGSNSGMSQQLVGSLSRGAMQILPALDTESSDSQVLFNDKSGIIQKSEVMHAKRLWKSFVQENEKSAFHAVHYKTPITSF